MPIQETETDESVRTEEIPHSAPNAVFAEQFGLITRRISRALLRHSKLPSFHDSPYALYSALQCFFEQWSLRQERALSMRVSPAAAARLLRYCEASLRPTKKRAHTAQQLVASAPLVPLDALKRDLESPRVHVVLSPLGEVLELARVLDSAQALHTPFGSVNVMHVAALGAALCPAANFSALLLLVAASLERCLTCAAVFYEWALIDRQNAESLRALQCVLERSGDAAPADIVAGELEGPLEGFGNGFVDEAGVAPRPPTVRGTVKDGERCIGKSHGATRGKRVESEAIVHEGTAVAQDDNDDDNGEAEEEEGEEEEEEEPTGQVDMDFWRQLCS